MHLEQGHQRHHYQATAGHLGMVHAGVTVGFDETVRRHGGNPARAVEASGLQHAFAGLPPVAQTPEIPLSAFSSLLRSAAEEASLPTFSLEFAQVFDVRSFGAIGYLFDLAPDLGTALKDFCAAFELLQKNTEIGIELHGDVARITYSVQAGTLDDKAPDAEFSIAMLGATLRKSHGGPSDVCRFDLEHHPAWERDAAPAWLGADIRPGASRNAIYVRRNVLDRPGRFKDAYLYRIVADRVFHDLRDLGSRNDLVSQVESLLRHAYSSGKFDQLSAPKVADDLGISVRSLHRQLALSGASFRDLRNSAMLESARMLLSGKRHSVTETALALGFSETSAFSRSFRQLSGQSPTQFIKS